MKKIVLLAMIVVLASGLLTACSSNNDQKIGDTKSTPSSTQNDAKNTPTSTQNEMKNMPGMDHSKMQMNDKK